MPSYEFMGAFGLAWQEVMAKNMGYPVTIWNASNYGAIVTAMNKRYEEYKKRNLIDTEIISKIASDTGQSEGMAKKFLDEIRKKEITGKVLAKTAETPEARISVLPAGINPLKSLTPLIVGAVALALILYAPEIKMAGRTIGKAGRRVKGIFA